MAAQMLYMISMYTRVPYDVVGEIPVEGVACGGFADVEGLESMVLGFLHKQRYDVGSGLAGAHDFDC